MLKDKIEKLLKKENLLSAECEEAIDEMITSDNHAQISAFLVLLQAKGETAEEISGFARGMRKNMIKVKTSFPCLDIVGTGGDRMSTFNISTAAALLAASCGAKIAKHGNRAVSSQCGSADILEALGIDINKKGDEVSKALDVDNFAFLFAPNFHPAMAKLSPVRKALGVPTFFNILGPLLNPAEPELLMLGVYKEELLEIMADALIGLGVSKALVFCGQGMDELTTAGTSKAYEITKSSKLLTVIDPCHFNFKKCSIEDLKCSKSQNRVAELLNIFQGKISAISDTVILNASFALKLHGLADSVESAVEIVRSSIKTGAAMEYIKRLSTSYQQAVRI